LSVSATIDSPTELQCIADLYAHPGTGARPHFNDGVGSESGSANSVLSHGDNVEHLNVAQAVPLTRALGVGIFGAATEHHIDGELHAHRVHRPRRHQHHCAIERGSPQQAPPSRSTSVHDFDRRKYLLARNQP